MKRLLPVLFLVFVFQACNCPEPSGMAYTEKEIDELYQLKEVDWPKAYREQDTVLLDKILAEEFHFITSDGSYSSKGQELDWIKNNPFSADSFYFEIKVVKHFENGTAIVAGTGHILVDSTETIYESSNILIRRDGRWQAISSHVSGVRELDE